MTTLFVGGMAAGVVFWAVFFFRRNRSSRADRASILSAAGAIRHTHRGGGF